MSNEQKYALVTGGTSGIGHELAKVFAREKYNLILVAVIRLNLTNAQQNLVRVVWK